MALGPGKYDSLCTHVRENALAEGAAIIIFNGQFGNGFSIQATAEMTAAMPRLLRQIAENIERSMGKS